MPKKSFKKKKAFQANCREQVKSGMINMENGEWRKADMSKRMHAMAYDGYNFKK